MADLGCISDVDLRAFVLGTLPDRLSQAVCRHLEGCATCEAAVQELDHLTDPLVRGIQQACRPEAKGTTDTAVHRGLSTENGLQSAEPVAQEISWPRALAGYTVEKELGRGGMGVVYQARQTCPARVVALKVLLVAAHADAERRARFFAEADAIARLQHPGIVQVYEVGRHDGLPFLALEYVAGGSLAERIKGQPQPPRQAAELVEALSRAVQHAHERGIVHRDLKPANILLASVGREPPDDDQQSGGFPPSLAECVAKITDFGLAKQERPDLTATGAILGTPSYMAPEQAAGDKDAVGPAADVYALGAILYELLTGRAPFRGVTALETLAQVRTQEPVPPTQLQPQLARDLSTICLKCLQKDPHKRYARALDLAEDLRRFLDGRPIRARPVGTPERVWRWCRRNPALAWAGGLAVFALVAAAVISIFFAFHTHAAADRQAQDARRLEGEKKQTQAALADVKVERDRARRRTRLAERRLAELYLERGHQICSLERDIPRGLLWLARALEALPKGEDDLDWNIRVSLAAWSRELCPLQGFIRQEGAMVSAAFGPGGRHGDTVATTSMSGSAQLWDAATCKPLGPPLEHNAWVQAVAVSPNGKTVLTGCDNQFFNRTRTAMSHVSDKTVRFWDPIAGNLLLPPLSHPGPVRKVAFTPDGKTALTASTTVRLWQVATGKLLVPPLQHAARITSAVFSPNGKMVLTTSADKTAQMWDVQTGKRLGPPLRHNDLVRTAIFSPDGKTVLTGSADRTARLWDAGTSKRGSPLLAPLVHPGEVYVLAFSRDGRYFLTGFGTRDLSEVRVWETATAKPTCPPLSHGDDSVANAIFLPEGRVGSIVVTGSRHGNVRFWEVATGQLLRPPVSQLTNSRTHSLAIGPDGKSLLVHTQESVRLYGLSSPRFGPSLQHEGMIQCLTFSPDGKVAVTGGMDCTARRWDTVTNKPLGPPLKHPKWVRSIAFHRDGKRFQTSSGKLAQMWDAATGRPIGRPLLHKGGHIIVARLSPDGRYAATAGIDAVVQLWRVSTRKAVGPPLVHNASVHHVAFSPDSKMLLTSMYPNMAARWEVPSGRPLDPPLRHTGIVNAMAFSPDGKTVLTGSSDRTARLWEAATGRPLGPPLAHEGRVTCVAFSPDGKTVLTGSGDKSARLWEVTTGKQLGPPLLHPSEVRCVAYSPDSQILVTGTAVVWLWQARTGRPLGPPLGFRMNVEALALTPNGRTVLAGSIDHTARFWQLPVPLGGKRERIKVWTRVFTGMDLDDHGVARVLDPLSWDRYRQRLRALGGPLHTGPG
jgi:WD40 repeat protein/serine/threonine protein kinase